MYKAKYLKYKAKLNSLVGSGSNNVDIIDGSEDDAPEEVGWDELHVISGDDRYEAIDNLIMDRSMRRGTQNMYRNTETNYKVVDIGIKYIARGRVHLPDELAASDMKNILVLSTVEQFDNFTDTYGRLDRETNKVFIRWTSVANDFLGIQIQESATYDRDVSIPYKTKNNASEDYESWLQYDFGYIGKIVIFKKERQFYTNRTAITKPFRAQVVDSYTLPSDDFIRITDPYTKDKILLIDDVKTFDKFTRQFGVVTPDKNGDQFISIKWKDIKEKYDGIYIDNTVDLKSDRYGKAYLNGKLYNSWWSKFDINDGVVYVFDQK